MSMNLYDGNKGLFDLHGKLFMAVADLNSARLTSVPAGINGYLAKFQNLVGAGVAFQQATDLAAATLLSWQQSGSILSQWAQAACSTLLASFVSQDSPQPITGDTNNLNYLIAQMIATSQYVGPNGVTHTLATVTGTDDVVIVYTKRRGDGQINQHALGEILTIGVQSNSSQTTPQLSIVGKIAESDELAWDWPLGSGSSNTITATDPANSLLANGNFELSTVNANVPDGWTLQVGVPGTTVLMSVQAIQTITVSGTPSAGFFYLQWTDPNGTTWTTGTLAYNATAGAVQAALNLIPGLSKVTATATGTSPNQTFTVNFLGQAGDLNNLSAVNQTTGGTIVVATTQHGDPGAFKGKALVFAGDETTLHTIYSPALNLSPDTVYFAHFRMRRSGTTPGGTVLAEVVGSIGAGSALNDDAGNANSLSIAATAVPTNAFTSNWFSFRLPASQTGPVYLRFRMTVAHDDGCNLYFDEATIFQGQELYPGGIFMGAVSGVNPVLSTDSWTLTVANDRAGKVAEWYNRVFDLSGKRLLLPGTGSSLIPDSVVS